MNSFYTDMSNEVYHASDGVSKSMLDLIHIDPTLIEWSKRCHVQTTKAFQFGTSLHAYLLEYKLFCKNYIIAPIIDKRTKVGKEIWNKFLKENINKTVLNPEDHTKIINMGKSVLSHPIVNELYKQKIYTECSLFTYQPDVELLLKARPDMVSKDKNDNIIIIDIKTIDDIDNIQRNIVKYRYYVQAAHYMSVLFHNKEINLKINNQLKFVFIFIAKKMSGGKYPVRVVSLDEKSIDIGIEEVTIDLYNYAKFKKQEDKNTIPLISLPSWKVKEHEINA